MLCNINNNSIAKIKIDDYIGPPIELKGDVAQGSKLSSNLFVMYTNGLPEVRSECIDAIFADDITQIITHPYKWYNPMGLRAVWEMNMNTYEK